MHITTAARHCDLTLEDRQAAQMRLERLARFLRERERQSLAVHLVVTGVRQGHEAEVVLRVGGHELVARENAGEARSAVEGAADQIERQIRRLKERSAARSMARRGSGASSRTTTSRCLSRSVISATWR